MKHNFKVQLDLPGVEESIELPGPMFPRVGDTLDLSQMQRAIHSGHGKYKVTEVTWELHKPEGWIVTVYTEACAGYKVTVPLNWVNAKTAY